MTHPSTTVFIVTDFNTNQSSPGYVAGVTNPVFAEQPSWWDICIDLSSNKMIISPIFMKTAGDSPKENSDHLGISCPEDDILIQQVLYSLL